MSNSNNCETQSTMSPWDESQSLDKLQLQSDACVHCGKCQETCAFLKKYEMDLSDVSKLQEHVRGCFLCGKCSEVCPMGIRGDDIFKELRRMEIRDNTRALKPYSFVLNEKCDYKFRNYRNATSGSALFPGCNFPSMFPKTNKYLEKVFREHGIGTVYDCCGKPIAELGLYKDEERIVNRISDDLTSRGINEIVTMCPNCYYFLRNRIPQRVTSIYNKLQELDVSLKPVTEASVYVPCPDRESHEWYDQIANIVGYQPEILNNAQCCGLGGMASAEEPELAKSFAQSVLDAEEPCESCEVANKVVADPKERSGKGTLTTFCASCAGQFARNGNSMPHILSLLLGVDEKPATKTSYMHRVLTKFK